MDFGNDPDLDDRILTPPRMGYLADQLEDAIRTMERWRIRIPPGSRLPEVVRLLRGLVSEASYPWSCRQRALVAHAARDAQEFAEISWVLPSEELKPLRESLRKAVFGTLGQTDGSAYRYQSELWTGSMLARSGALTGVRVASEGQSPDFILKNATMEYAVEVKRPSNLSRALDRVSGAARQLRDDRYHGGAIVLDLTDCLGPEHRDLSGRGQFQMEDVEARVVELTDSLRKKVFDDSSYRMRPGRRHVFARLPSSERSGGIWTTCRRCILSVTSCRSHSWVEARLCGTGALAGSRNSSVRASGRLATRKWTDGRLRSMYEFAAGSGLPVVACSWPAARPHFPLTRPTFVRVHELHTTAPTSYD